MKQLYLRVIFLSLLTISSAFSQQQAPDTVYGEDNRKDLFEVTNPLYLEAAQSTVALFGDGALNRMTYGGHFVSSYKYGEQYDLCITERFYDQRSGAFCSGFLVAPDIIATAGHCVMNQTECLSTKVAFGFAIASRGQSAEYLEDENVYSCKELIAHKYTWYRKDFSLFRLDRPVTHAKPLKLNLTGVIEKDAKFVVMGHPGGTPLKIAEGAVLRHNRKFNPYFVTNTDTFTGNSGSAVINSKTGLVEGILVRGGKDYKYKRKEKCYVAKQCKDSKCRGEDVMKPEVFSKYLQ